MSIRQSAPGDAYRPPHGYGPQSPPVQPPGAPLPPTESPQSAPPSSPTRHRVPSPPGDPGSSSRRWLVIGLAVLAALGLVVIGVVAARLFGHDAKPAAVPARSANHVATAPVGDLTEASFDILTAASALTLKATDLGNDLYRVETPGDGALLPQVDGDGDHRQLRLLPSGNNAGPGSVTIQLNAKIAWNLKLTGGAADEAVDLRLAKLTGLDVVGGGQKIEVWVPRPSGAMTVTMSGGAGQFLLHTPKGVPAKVRVAQGAGMVTVDGTAKQSVAAGTEISSSGWDAAKDKFDVAAAAGAAGITVDQIG